MNKRTPDNARTKELTYSFLVDWQLQMEYNLKILDDLRHHNYSLGNHFLSQTFAVC